MVGVCVGGWVGWGGVGGWVGGLCVCAGRRGGEGVCVESCSVCASVCPVSDPDFKRNGSVPNGRSAKGRAGAHEVPFKA